MEWQNNKKEMSRIRMPEKSEELVFEARILIKNAFRGSAVTFFCGKMVPQSISLQTPKNVAHSGFYRFPEGGATEMRLLEWGALSILLPRAPAWLE